MLAGFGLLFAGCGPAIRGPGDAGMEEFAFTEDDLEAMRAKDANNSGSVTVSEDDLALISSASGVLLSAKDVPPVDLSKMSLYDAIRSAGKQGAYKVTNGFVNVRAGPDPSAAFVARLENGVLVNVIEFTNASWVKVELSPGKTGFIASRYISKLTTDDKFAEDKKAFENQFYVNFGFVNMRNQPTQQSEKILEIPGQAILKPISMDSEWARVSFGGREGFVSREYLDPFLPNFVVRQERFTLPILLFDASDPTLLPKLPSYIQALKNAGSQVLTFKSFAELLESQEQRDVRLPPRSVMLGVTGLTSQNVRQVSDVFSAEALPVTLFMQSDQFGITGITEKVTLTLLANGFDIQSATDSGKDLRTLTTQQMQYELQQSRHLLEKLTKTPVIAVWYPQGGSNDRVEDSARAAGYLLGVGNTPDTLFDRSRFLMLPSIPLTGALTPDQVVALTQNRP